MDVYYLQCCLSCSVLNASLPPPPPARLAAAAAAGAAVNDSRAQVLPTHTVFLRQLNETDGPMLLAGSSDGAVRVWRSYTLPTCQRMASALQVCWPAPLPTPLPGIIFLPPPPPH